MPGYRRVAITHNNYTPEILDQYRALVPTTATFAIGAHEIGESGTPHIQGYLELTKQQRFAAVKEALPQGCHIETAHANQAANITYVLKGAMTKEEWDDCKERNVDARTCANYGKDLQLLFRLGTEKSQGKRNDLDGVMSMVAEGKSLLDICEAHGNEFIKFSKGIKEYRAIMTQPRDPSTAKNVIVHFGNTGTGKTRTAMENHPGHYLQGPENKYWWPNYDGQKVVILEEFRAQVTFGYLLRLTDRYPMQVEYKGGNTEFLADTIIITSPNHPAYWYKPETTKDGALSQLKRRITKILHFKGENEIDQDPTDVTDEPWPQNVAFDFGVETNQFQD